MNVNLRRAEKGTGGLSPVEWNRNLRPRQILKVKTCSSTDLQDCGEMSGGRNEVD